MLILLLSISKEISIELQSVTILCEILIILRTFIINMVTPSFLFIIPSEFTVWYPFSSKLKSYNSHVSVRTIISKLESLKFYIRTSSSNFANILRILIERFSSYLLLVKAGCASCYSMYVIHSYYYAMC